LNTLGCKKTVLIVDAASSVSQALDRGARNLDGVDVMLSSDVHPYDLLKAERTIISRPALEQLHVSLGKTVSKRKAAAKAEKEAA
jgi:large subunit ribosomal protein L4